MSPITSSSERASTRPSAISRERRSMTSFHCVSASASTVSSRLAISWRARNARSFSGRANTSATFQQQCSCGHNIGVSRPSGKYSKSVAFELGNDKACGVDEGRGGRAETELKASASDRFSAPSASPSQNPSGSPTVAIWSPLSQKRQKQRISCACPRTTDATGSVARPGSFPIAGLAPEIPFPANTREPRRAVWERSGAPGATRREFGPVLSGRRTG